MVMGCAITQMQPRKTMETKMANVNDSISNLLKVDGAMAAAVVDSNSGMVLGKEGTGVNLDIAGAGNTEVVRAKLKTMKSLGLKDKIEDMLITLGSQFHIIRPLTEKPGLFIYLVLDRSKANLAMARIKCADVDAAIEV
jgi:predicted regulator of Ras-like GTPase activity (Roadblock/LC7/MglB family)